MTASDIRPPRDPARRRRSIAGRRPTAGRCARFDWPADGDAARLASCSRAGAAISSRNISRRFAHWHAPGWTITAFDWRGQGGSGRLTAPMRLRAYRGFRRLDRRSRAPSGAEWQAEHAGPHVVIGHSMGGHLVLRALVERRGRRPTRAVLVAPMLGLHSPFGARFGERLARLIGGVRRSGAAGVEGQREALHHATRRQSLLTARSPTAMPTRLWWREQTPEHRHRAAELALGDRGVRVDARARAPIRGSRRCDVPVLMLVAEADGLVDPRRALAGRRASCRDARVVRFGAESAHEILREVDRGARPRARRDRRCSWRRGRSALSRTTSRSSAPGSPGRAWPPSSRRTRACCMLEARGPARLSRHRALGGLLVGNLWRARRPAADHRLGAGARAAAILQPRGSLHIGRAEDAAAIDAFLADFAGSGRRAGARSIRATLIPGLRAEWTLGVVEPSCAYIDVAALHAALSRDGAARAAASWSPTRALAARRAREAAAGGSRRRAGAFEADDPRQCRRRLGRSGRGDRAASRRSASSPIAARWCSCAPIPRRPAACRWSRDIAGSFYFKPEAGGRLWLSPHDEIAGDPCDVAPEELDVAIAIDRLRACRRLAGRRGRAQMGRPAQLRARSAAGLRLRPAACPASSGAPGRAASASRPRPPRRSWPRPAARPAARSGGRCDRAAPVRAGAVQPLSGGDSTSSCPKVSSTRTPLGSYRLYCTSPGTRVWTTSYVIPAASSRPAIAVGSGQLNAK